MEHLLLYRSDFTMTFHASQIGVTTTVNSAARKTIKLIDF